MKRRDLKFILRDGQKHYDWENDLNYPSDVEDFKGFLERLIKEEELDEDNNNEFFLLYNAICRGAIDDFIDLVKSEIDYVSVGKKALELEILEN